MKIPRFIKVKGIYFCEEHLNKTTFDTNLPLPQYSNGCGAMSWEDLFNKYPSHLKQFKKVDLILNYEIYQNENNY